MNKKQAYLAGMRAGMRAASTKQDVSPDEFSNMVYGLEEYNILDEFVSELQKRFIAMESNLKKNFDILNRIGISDENDANNKFRDLYSTDDDLHSIYLNYVDTTGDKRPPVFDDLMELRKNFDMMQNRIHGIVQWQRWALENIQKLRSELGF